MTNLLDPRTRWRQLFPSLEQAAHEVLGVADQQAQLFTGIDQTFTPLSQDTPALQAAIVGGPPSLQTATRELPAQAKFMDDSDRAVPPLPPGVRQSGQRLGPVRAGDQRRPPGAAADPGPE